MLKTTVKTVLVLVVVGLIAIQFVPVERTNPPVKADVAAPAAVQALLRRSCYDCHSHETRWPWYSHVAPVSWFLADHVRHARSELNFSAWERYSTAKVAEIRQECWEKVDGGEMPLASYLLLHPDARPTAAERAVLRAWAGKSGERGEEEEEHEAEEEREEHERTPHR